MNISVERANKIVEQHGTKLPNGQVFLTKPLGVFKKVGIPSTIGGYRVDQLKDAIRQTRQLNSGPAPKDIKTHLLNLNNWDIEDAVANLILPVGTLVNLADINSGTCKMRASRAICWSIYSCEQRKRRVNYAFSKHDTTFIYSPIQTNSNKNASLKLVLDAASSFQPLSCYSQIVPGLVVPDHFCTSVRECSEGVHFFIHSRDAVDY